MTEKEFFKQLSLTETGKAYLNLVNQNKVRELVKEPGFEIHHIFPRCFGGTNKKVNLVKLTVRDHLYAHYLLLKSINHPKLLYSFSFIVGPQYRKLSSEDQISLEQLEGWAELRNKALHRTLTEEHKARIGQANKGKYVGKKRPREVVEKFIKSRVESGHSKHSPETCKKISEGLTGKLWTLDRRRRASKARKGRPSGFKGKKHTQESNRKNRESHLNRVHINNGVTAKMIPQLELEEYLSQGWKLGRIWKKSKKST